MLAVSTSFKALGDPIRIEMLQRLTRRRGYSIGEISDGLPITRQGARKHIHVLASAGLIHLHKKGRITEVQLKPNSLVMMKKFIEKMEMQWDQRLLKLKEFIENNEGSD